MIFLIFLPTPSSSAKDWSLGRFLSPDDRYVLNAGTATCMSGEAVPRSMSHSVRSAQ